MVALSFKAQFAQPIIEGRKTHTLRRRRKGKPIAEGDKLQLFTGMRTKHCRRIGAAVCDRICEANIDLSPKAPIICIAGRDISPEAFALADGFDSLDAMRDFWAEEHGTLQWSGHLIGWTDFKPEEAKC